MTCELCDGNKWVFVLPGYVNQQAPVPSRTDVSTDDEYAALLNENRMTRAALANTTYPCRQCSPSAFFRWAGGHLDPEHETADCAECRRSNAPRHGGHARRRRGPEQPPLPAPPGDLLEDDEPPSQDWTHTRKDLE